MRFKKEALIKLREKSGRTKQELLWALNEKFGARVAWLSIHKWEGKNYPNSKPDIFQLYCLAKIFNKSMEDFIV